MYIHINICNCQGLIHSLKLDILWIPSVLQKTLVLGEIVEYNITNRHSRSGLGLNLSTGKPLWTDSLETRIPFISNRACGP